MEPNTKTKRPLDTLAHEFVEVCKRHGLDNVTEAIVVIVSDEYTEIVGIHSSEGPNARCEEEVEEGYRSGKDLTPKIEKALYDCMSEDCAPGTVFIDLDATGTSYDALIKFKQYGHHPLRLPVILFNDPVASLREHCETFQTNKNLIDSLLFLVEHTVRRFIPTGFEISVDVLKD